MHYLTIRTGEEFWLDCSCGWTAYDLTNNWDEWARMCEQHRAETDPTKVMADALRLIDRYGCTNLTSGRCSAESSGRTRDAEYRADQWCDACIAAEALKLAVA